VVAGSPVYAQTYQEVASLVGLQLDHTVADICNPPLSAGSAWGDYDNDDDVDLMVTGHGASSRLYQNQGDTDFDGLPDFIDVAVAAGVDAPAEISISAVFIDYDNDGDQDLYVSNWGGNQLFENQLIESGSAVFTDVTATAGLADEGRAITTAWADFDNDGFLDVYLAKHRECGDNENSGDRLYRANGDGTFANVTAWLCDGCDEIETSLSFAPAWLDYDNDGDLDLYVVNDAIQAFNAANQLWQNQGPDDQNPGQWKFENVTVAAGADIRLNGMGQGVGDIDNDGFLDIAMSNVGANVLLHNQGDGTFADITQSAGVDRAQVPDGSGVSTTWGTVFFDYNNDGRIDLYFTAGNIADNPTPVQTNAMFRNDGGLSFTDVSDETGLNSSLRGRNVSTVDFDADGWIDVFDGNFAYAPALYHNDSAALGLQDNWLQITVEGTVDNRDAIGTRIWATTPAPATQTREINTGPTHGGGDERVAHFGLRQANRASVKVRWPNGAEQELGNFDANQRVHIVQNLLLGDVDPDTTTLQITGADPGDSVVLGMGLQAGSRPVPGCPGVTLDITNARRVDTETADGIGVATLTSPTPQSLAGRTVLYQAFESNSCRTSNVVEFTFPVVP
jgi:hypothetical protein